MSVLDGYSPFDVGFGRRVNCMEIGLGDERGFMKVWVHGEFQIWGNEEDPLGPPSITFNPGDAELLRELANELESRAGEYQEYLRQQTADPLDSQTSSSTAPAPSPVPAPSPAPAPAKKPQIVAGSGATEQLNNFCLK
jgi:hypothetical protein